MPILQLCAELSTELCSAVERLRLGLMVESEDARFSHLNSQTQGMLGKLRSAAAECSVILSLFKCNGKNNLVKFYPICLNGSPFSPLLSLQGDSLSAAEGHCV